MRPTPTLRAIAASLASLIAAAPLAQAADTCIRTQTISSFEYPNDKTVLVNLYGGAVYRNDLPQRCFGLKMAINGITYTPSIPGSNELCDNIGVFRVNDSGTTCLWGGFTKVK